MIKLYFFKIKQVVVSSFVKKLKQIIKIDSVYFSRKSVYFSQKGIKSIGKENEFTGENASKILMLFGVTISYLLQQFILFFFVYLKSKLSRQVEDLA